MIFPIKRFLQKLMSKRIQKQKPLKRLRIYFAYRTTLFTLVSFSLLILVIILYLQNSSRKQLINLQRSLTQVLEEEVRLRVKAAQKQVEMVADFWSSGVVDSPVKEEFLSLGKALLQSEPAIFSLWLVDSDSHKVKGTLPFNKTLLGYDCSGFDAQYRKEEPEIIFQPQWSPIQIHPYFYNLVFSLRMKTKTDYLIAWIDPHVFLLDFTTPRFANIEYLSLFACDEEGNLLTHPDFRLVGQRINIRSIPAIKEALQ
ncbi:MAG: hypothetical protein SNJ78_11810, partial [Spirochaetales bacterium]